MRAAIETSVDFDATISTSMPSQTRSARADRCSAGERDGKVSVITGAGSGMGRASARAFVREGARVVGVDISGREKEIAEELGDAFIAFSADVSNERDVAAMFAEARKAFGRVDAVLNVAGIGDQQ